MTQRTIETNRQNRIGTALARVPPEAVLKLTEIVGTIVVAGLEMAVERQRFEQKLETIRQADITVTARLQLLLGLVESVRISDAARDRLVEAICELAVR